jgi:hypothetical protein
MVALLHGLNDLAVRAFVERAEDGGSLAEAEALVAAYVQAMERILGVPAGTISLVDRAALREWYG